jgi:hypothetical protein
MSRHKHKNKKRFQTTNVLTRETKPLRLSTEEQLEVRLANGLLRLKIEHGRLSITSVPNGTLDNKALAVFPRVSNVIEVDLIYANSS